MKNINYIRTDLADECVVTKDNRGTEGISVYSKQLPSCSLTEIEILDEEGERQSGKPVGEYITLKFGKIWLSEDRVFNDVSNVLSGELKKIVKMLLPNTEYPSVLVAGLGNRFITSDAIGPQVVNEINVTRHIYSRDKNLFDKLGKWNISAISPGVIGQTGIETEELIKCAVENIKPDLLVVVDALASKSVDRLATTVQITNTGICPGSGIGNTGKAINRENIGIPVIAIGVPTMVDSSTLVYDALTEAGIENISEKLEKVLENGRSFFVTLNESDIVISSLSKLIANAVNLAFSV